MNEWMEHPTLKNLDPAKRELIQMAARQTSGKTGKSLAPVMMTLITGANRKGIQFTREEMSLILEILKDGKSPEEQMQIDSMVAMVQQMQRKKSS